MSLRLLVCFAILFQCGFGEPESCYFCNTDVHGQGCNDPIVTDQIQVQTCSNMETVQEGASTFSKVWDYFMHHSTNNESVAITTRNTTSYPNVCYYMTYVYNEKIVSQRGCESQRRDTLWGQAFEICDYYSQIYPTNRVSNFSCKSCADNLCNHANHLNVPSSAANLVISIKLIVVLLIAKFYAM